MKKRKLIMLHLLISKNGYQRARYLEKAKVFHSFGKKCYWHPFNIPSEPYLVSIHNNVSVASGVKFITHDILCNVFNNSPQYKETYKYYMGKIEIFDNVFIGANAIIMYNVKIGENSIVAAGSVVTKDVPEGSIVGGNPARVIGQTKDLAMKRAQTSNNMPSDHDDFETINRYFWKEK